MPTTLPPRSRDSDFGRKRGFSHSAAALLMWAVAMLAISAVSPVARPALAETGAVQP